MAKKAKKSAKRGRPPGKVGPYKMSFSQMQARLKVVEARLSKLEKVLN